MRLVLKELTILKGLGEGSRNCLISSLRFLGNLGHKLTLSEKQMVPISSCCSVMKMIKG